MGTRTLWRSFAGGVLTPEMYGRKDLAKYQTGLAKCINFRTLPHGPAERRPGFRFVNQAFNSAQKVRLIPFAFNATQTVVLEFGDLYIRFHINGATLLESSKTITSIVGNIVTTSTTHGYTAGNWVYIGGRYFVVGVTGSDDFAVSGLRGQPAQPTPGSPTVARVYQLVSPYASPDLFGIHYAQNSDVLTLVHPKYAARELKRLGATSWTLTTINFAPSMTIPTGLTVVATVQTSDNLSSQRYAVTAVATDGVTESTRSSSVAVNNNLSIAGNYNTISWSATAGASRYNIYKQRGGSYGYIGQTTSLSIVDDNVLPDLNKTPPESIYDFNTGTGDFPAAVTYHEQRRWFAGTINEPQTVWATRNGTESNLTSSLPAQDDDGLEFRIAARQQNAILHLVPLSDLLALTVGAEFRLYADNAPSITPTSLSIKPQGYSGANNAQPVTTSGSILFVQSQGARVRELSFNWQTSAYATVDVSLFVPQLFNGFTVNDIAYSRAPVPEFYAVRSDGRLLAMTYVPEQQVYGWHEHDTDGFFESVCTVSEGSEDVLYALVCRTIDGVVVRYIEKLSSRILVSQADAFYIDCGATYAGVPADVISGLWHLEGKEVQILLDGATHPNRTVTNGTIVLEANASKVQIGLPYVSDLQTLPIIFEMPAAGDGMTRNVNSIRMRVTQSSVMKAGLDPAKLVDVPARSVADNYDSPPALRTHEVRVQIPASWNADGSVWLRQDSPLPLTVLSMVLDAQTGG